MSILKSRTMIDHYEEIFKVPPEMLDLVYSHMLDTSPDKLYDLITSKSNESEWEMHQLDESAIQCSDQASSSDEIVESPREPMTRYGNVAANPKELKEVRRQSIPVVLENLNVFSASLQISIPKETSGRESQLNKMTEPKLPASISNIGGATLSAKTAEFERNSNGSQAQVAPLRKKTLYKRQQLIPSSKRS